MLFYQLVNARLSGFFLEPRADAVVRHDACTQWEIVLRLNDRKMSMDKNVKRGLTGRVILPDVVWHVFSVVSGGYNKVTGGDCTPPPPPLQLHLCLLQTSFFQITIHAPSNQSTIREFV